VTKDFFDFQLSLILDEKSLPIHNEMMRVLIYCCDSTNSEAIVIKEEKPAMDDIAAACTLQDGKYVVNTNQFIEASSMSQEGHFGKFEPEYMTVNFVDSEGAQESQPNNYYDNTVSQTYTRLQLVQPMEVVKSESPSPPVDWLFNIEDVQPDFEDYDVLPSTPSNVRNVPSTIATTFCSDSFDCFFFLCFVIRLLCNCINFCYQHFSETVFE